MYRGLGILLLCLSAFSAWGQYVHPDYVDGKLFVKTQSQLQGPKWDALTAQYGISSPKYAFRTPEVQDVATLYFSQKEKVAALIAELESWPEVVYAERVPLYRTTHIPNDIAPEQYAIDLIQAPKAWNLSRGADSIVVFVIDDGFMLDHEDLIDQIWTFPGEIPGDSIDNDGNGFIDDVNGYDVADNDADPGMVPGAGWDMAHGTHVAGIAVASTNNGKGVASPAYNCSFVPVKAKSDTSLGMNILEATAEGMDYALSSGARIVNMSFAGNGASTTVQSLISTGYFQGVTWVAGAGNEGQFLAKFPAAYDHVVSVGGTNSMDEKSGFSNWHSSIDVMAPGTGIWSCFAVGTDEYTYMSGTSMSCPMTAGVCALILSINPDLIYGEVEQYLRMGCDNINAQNPDYIGRMGSGRINAFRSLMAVPRRNAPIAGFETDSDTVCANAEVLFRDLSQEFPQHWRWDFGDGSQDTTQGDVGHAFSQAGNYTVSLIVENNKGADTSIAVQQLVVLPAPELMVDFQSMPGSGTEFQFTASGCSTYTWSPANFLSCTDCPDPIYAPGAAIPPSGYSCLCTNANGCTDQDSLQTPVNVDVDLQRHFSLAPPFPNPSQGAVLLQASFPQPGALRIELRDLLGRKQGQLFEGLSGADFQMEIRLPEKLPTGSYLIHWEFDGQVQTQRIVLQKP